MDIWTASKVAYRFVRGTSSTSEVSLEIGAIATDPAAPQRSGSGLFRLSMLKVPATFLSRNCLGFQEPTTREGGFGEDTNDRLRTREA